MTEKTTTSETLNPGIRRVVAWLNEAGFTTCDSGDGETHEHECDRDVAYVSITIEHPGELIVEAERLLRLLASVKITAVPFGPDDGVSIVASYDPSDGTAILDLTGLDDRKLAEGLPS